MNTDITANTSQIVYNAQKNNIDNISYDYDTENELDTLDLREIDDKEYKKTSKKISNIPHNKHYKNSEYITDYINIDSSNRTINATLKSDYKKKLENNPFRFSGTDLRIAINDTDIFNINDKIILNGLDNMTTTIRTSVNIDGVEEKYVIFNEYGYAEIHADTNIYAYGMNADAVNNNVYGDIRVTMDGFIGDKKTEYIFDFTGFNFYFEKKKDTYIGKITENVGANSSDISGNTEMLIGEFEIDKYGNIISINTKINNKNTGLRWLNTDGTYTKLPQEYLSAVNDATLLLDSKKCTNIYDAIKYIQQIQNKTRPIFKKLIGTSSSYKNSVDWIKEVRISNTSFIGNIPVNYLNNIHNMYLTKYTLFSQNNIPNPVLIPDIPVANIFYIYLYDIYTKRIFDMVMPSEDMVIFTTYENIVSDISITYNHYGGILTNRINSDRYIEGEISFKYVKQIVKDKYIIIDIGQYALYKNIDFGGNDIYIEHLSDYESGYPLPNNYVVSLEKIYSRIVKIRMVNSVFPKTYKLINDGLTGGKRNNRFYWQYIMDSKNTFMIEIPPGNYDADTLALALKSKIEEITYFNEIINKYTNNKIDIQINKESNTVIFKDMRFLYSVNIDVNSFEYNKITNTFKNSYYSYPSGTYYNFFPNANLVIDLVCITINIFKNQLRVGDTIEISNCPLFIGTNINGKHIVTRVDNNSYDIIIYDASDYEIYEKTHIQNIEDIKVSKMTISVPVRFRILFDKPDTLGEILGFRNIGNETSITPYDSTITNDTLYDFEIRNNYRKSNQNIRKNILVAYPAYFLITCDEISNMSNTSTDIRDIFYKINTGTNSDSMQDVNNKSYIYDSYVDTPIYFNEPLKRLSKLTLQFLNPDGTYFDFGTSDHSFVLEIVTYEITPKQTSLDKIQYIKPGISMRSFQN